MCWCSGGSGVFFARPGRVAKMGAESFSDPNEKQGNQEEGGSELPRPSWSEKKESKGSDFEAAR